MPTSLSFNPDACEPALARALQALAGDYPIHQRGSAPESSRELRFEAMDSEHPAFEYALEGEAVVIRYQGLNAALRAVGAALSGFSEARKEELKLTRFGVMLESSRNAVMKVDGVKAWLRCLALYGYNELMLYTEDTYELEGEPFFGYLRGGYKQEELTELHSFAAELGIELVPCIQTLGHMEQALHWPVYADIRDQPGILMPKAEGSYALIEKMVSHFRSLYTSNRIYIGMDEAHGLGRGEFQRRFGYEDPFAVFNEHLARVVDICKKYGFEPVIWSDMYFRLGSKDNQYYDLESEIPQEVADAIHKDVRLCYWDYYHADKDFYLEWIRRHRALGFEPVVASGVWTWSKLWSDQAKTERLAGPCVEAVEEAGLTELLVTVWGDDGAYCDLDSGLTGLQFIAEKAWCESVEESAMSARHTAILGGDLEAQRTISALNEVHYPSSIFWDDPLMAIYFKSLYQEDKDSLKKAARTLDDLIEQLDEEVTLGRAGSLSHGHITLEILAAKCALGQELFTAYQAKDKSAVDALCQRAGRLEALYEQWLASFRRQWMARNKPQGFEVMQIRIGGLIQRYRELATRLREWQHGEVEQIDELEEMTGIAAEHRPEEPYKYRELATSSRIL